MLAELVDRLFALGQGYRQVTQVRVKGVRDAVWFDTHDGEPKRIELDPPREILELASFNDFIAELERMLERKPVPTVLVPPRPIGVVPTPGRMIAYAADPRRAISLSLEFQARWLALRSLPQAYSPKDAVAFLRRNLGGLGGSHLVPAISRLDFKRSSGTSVDLQRGRESLGRSVEAAVQQAEQVPESFPVTVCPFSNEGLQSFSAGVSVNVDLLPERELVEFWINEDALRVADLSVRHQIAAEVVRCAPGARVLLANGAVDCER